MQLLARRGFFGTLVAAAALMVALAVGAKEAFAGFPAITARWLSLARETARSLPTSMVLFVCWRVSGNTHRSRRTGDERLEILREQQERLRVMYRERNTLKEELEGLRSLMDEGESLRELPALADGEQHVQQEIRPWWRRMLAA